MERSILSIKKRLGDTFSITLLDYEIQKIKCGSSLQEKKNLSIIPHLIELISEYGFTLCFTLNKKPLDFQGVNCFYADRTGPEIFFVLFYIKIKILIFNILKYFYLMFWCIK